MIDKISRNNFNENLNKIDENEIFTEVQEDFKLILLVSYTSKKFSFMNDVLEKAHSLDKKYNLRKFDYFLRTNGDKPWNKEFFEEKFKDISKKDAKVYLCGPVGFMEFVRKTILETDKIQSGDILYT